MSGAGEPGFKLVKKGSILNDNSLDAITGATMTSERVERMLGNTAGVVAVERSNRSGRGR